MQYTYLGDRFTDPKYRRAECNAVRNEKGKCIRGRNGSMLVRFESGETVVIVGRRLRKIKIVQSITA
jgi:hypothetical protein